jgi:hypothetical protein
VFVDVESEGSAFGGFGFATEVVILPSETAQKSRLFRGFGEPDAF